MDGIDQLIGMWSDCQKCLYGEFGECLVTFRISTAHDCYHLMSELERVWLEFDSLLLGQHCHFDSVVKAVVR